MTANYPQVRLGDVAEIIGGGTPSTSRVEYWNGDVPWITPKDLTGYTNVLIGKGERNITESGLKNSSARLLPKGTVLLTTRAPIGYVAIASNELCTNQGFKSFIVDENKAHNIFLYYWLKLNKEYLQSIGTGTTFMEIPGKAAKEIKIPLPPLPIQRSIAATLSCLDDKIELNNRINANLEAQAQAIFKSWFVDFEPFQDGDFVDSELGKIPIGWKVGILSDIGNIVGGSTPSKEKKEYFAPAGTDIAWITPKDLSINKDKYISHGETDITKAGYENSSASLMPKNSVLFSVCP